MSTKESELDTVNVESSENGTPAQNSENELLKDLLEGVYQLTSPPDNHKSATVFHALPERRLTAYYKIIKRPYSLYRIKQNIAQKKYSGVAEFIYDFAQITYNARVFNRKNSVIYNDALILDNYLTDVVIKKLRETGNYTEDELKYPEIGPLPEGSDNDEYYEETPILAAGNSHQYDDDEDDIDDDFDDDDEYGKGGNSGSGRRRSGRPTRRSVLLGQKRKKEEEEEERQQHQQQLQNSSFDNERRSKRRGRPPTVDRPHEYRIKAILRAVRKEKDEETGNLLCAPFEKLPDARLYPDYYTEINEPICLDQIRKNIKGRKYHNVDEFLDDMRLMFSNAKIFNAEDSQIYEDAVNLEKVMDYVTDEELKKPDSIYQDMESSHSKTARLPLDEVLHRGDKYHVGDWVHLSNPNDPAKPIVGQIFRIWQTNDGSKWVNVCWYFRPEQTVHRVDRLFYQNEVVKSGQYRDHPIDEILEKCFVMFISKYIRGRPAGIAPNTFAYCCENRYNEQEKTFNRIRTWKACLPDEVRQYDYAMSYYERPLVLKRLPSPIKHLLPENAKDDDPIPEPKMGVENAPPIVGAVYLRPHDPNEPLESPTPEGTADDVGPTGPIHLSTLSSNSINVHASSSIISTPLPSSARRIPNPSTHNVALVVPSNTTPIRFTAPNSITSTPSSNIIRQSPLSNRSQPPSSIPPHLQQYPILPPGVPTINPTSYTIPDIIQNILPSNQLSGVAKNSKSHQMLWFPSTPLYIPQRHVTHHIRKDLTYLFRFANNGYDLNDDVEDEIPGSRSTVGHSAKYIAWKLSKSKSQ